MTSTVSYFDPKNSDRSLASPAVGRVFAAVGAAVAILAARRREQRDDPVDSALPGGSQS
jgi:hypothetical protein